MARLPHTLHLEVDKGGWLTWTLECPYSATEVDDQVGRPCNLLTENPKLPPQPPDNVHTAYMRDGVLIWEDWSDLKHGEPEPVPEDHLAAWMAYRQADEGYRRWVPIPGCFAKESLDAIGFEDSVHLDMRDPSFPLRVDIEVDGYGDDATTVIVPWVEQPAGV